ncbi:MAG: hypothetical protein ACJAWV_001231, partial [Flammeovirgaceae bacterium]
MKSVNTTKSFFFSFLFLLLVQVSWGQTDPKWEWVTMPSSGQAEILDLEEDGEGNLYVCGVISSDLDFGGGNVISKVTVGENGFIAKFTVNGDYLWGYAFSGDGNGAAANALTLDTTNNRVYFVGHAIYIGGGEVQFDNSGGLYTHSITTTGQSAFIAKFGENGLLEWVRTPDDGSTQGNEGFNDVVLGTTSEVYAVGDASAISPSSLDFGNGQAFALTTSTHFIVAKYNDGGACQWVDGSSSGGNAFGRAITTNSGGTKIYVAGELTSGDITVQGTSLGATTDFAFMAAYQSNKSDLWAGGAIKLATGTGVASFQVNSLIALSDGNLGISATYQGANLSMLTSAPFSSNGGANSDIFIGTAKDNGTTGLDLIATHTIGSTEHDYVGRIYEIGGSLYVSGYFAGSDPVDFGNGINLETVGNSLGSDLFIAKYTTSGLVCEWAKRAGFTGISTNDVANAVFADGNRIYSAGKIQADADFDDITAGISSLYLSLLREPGIVYVDSSLSTGFNNGSSWANAYVDLQDALDNAIAGDEIWVAKGTYYPSQKWDYLTGNISTGVNKKKAFKIPNGVALYGGLAGGETDLTSRVAYGLGGTNETILSADLSKDDIVGGTFPFLTYQNYTTDNVYHVVLTHDVDSSTVLDG